VTYPILLLAASYLLARWQVLGSRTVRLADGRIEPEPTSEPGAWPIDTPEAAQVLTATVLAGQAYAGWTRALRTAQRALGRLP
jgi:hypothetical protein